jgi:uncharacterized membrane protein
MPSVTKEVFIEAPIEEIFNFVNKPGNLPQIWPSLVEIKDEKLLANGGYSFSWKYQMFGIPLSGKGQCVDLVLKAWLVSKTTGSVESTHTWTFRVKENKTRVTLTVYYQLPSQFLNRIADNVLVHKNEKEAEMILENLRREFETRVKTTIDSSGLKY